VRRRCLGFPTAAAWPGVEGLPLYDALCAQHGGGPAPTAPTPSPPLRLGEDKDDDDAAAAESLLRRLLTMDPARRCSGGEALQSAYLRGGDHHHRATTPSPSPTLSPSASPVRDDRKRTCAAPRSHAAHCARRVRCGLRVVGCALPAAAVAQAARWLAWWRVHRGGDSDGNDGAGSLGCALLASKAFGRGPCALLGRNRDEARLHARALDVERALLEAMAQGRLAAVVAQGGGGGPTRLPHAKEEEAPRGLKRKACG
jgi:hypothetical protein